MKDSFNNLKMVKRIFSNVHGQVFSLLLPLFLLLFIQRLEMILSQFLEIVKATEHHFFTSEAQAHRVRRKHYLLKSIGSIAFQSTDEVVR